jgi:signal transduction histidine kinase
MRLRHRLLGLFALCAVAPLLAIGVFSHVRSLRTVEALVESRAVAQAERMARVFRDRLDHLESDMSLLSGNEETQQLLAAHASGDVAAVPALTASHDRYIAELWRNMQFGYERVTLRDVSGLPVLALGDNPVTDTIPWAAPGGPRIVRPIVATGGGARLGELEVRPRLGDLLRGVGLEDRFGERGRNLLLDRESGRILGSGGRGDESAPSIAVASLADSTGIVRYEDEGERRIAAFASFASPPWTVLATASVDEFAGPFLRQRAVDLGLLLLVVFATSAGFFLLLRRATRSLDQLAAAAGRVGQGDLAPALPPETADEVGHLASAFRVMTGRLREMLAQVEAGRQTAVLGQFAVELAHEIRNPLTSVKLNLQGLERDGREGRIPEDSRVAVAMALREIHRLDQALRTALRVGRPAAEVRPYNVHAVLEEAAALLQPEATGGGITIERHPDAPYDRVRGDPEAVRGVFVNVLLNGIQAMQGDAGLHGGRIRVATRPAALDAGAPAIEVRIRDQGPGIPAGLRDRVFQPFFTTRSGGTGLGLSVALQTVQSQGGTLRLSADPGPGAEVIITLPIDPDGTAA